MAKVCILSSVHDALDNRVFYREASSLQRAGYDVTLIAVHDRDEVKDGIHIVPLPRVPRWQRPWLWLRLLRLALATSADLYLFHDPELLLVTPLLRRLSGSPTVYDIHEAYPEFILLKDYLPRWVRTPVAWAFRWAEPLLARLQSALVFSDEQIAASFAHVRRPKATISNFPSRAFVDGARQATHVERPREPVVLYLGGLERNRGSQVMVEAFEQVHRAVPEARLLVVGHYIPAELEDEVRADVEQRGLSAAVSLVGRVPFEQIGAHLARSSVGWVPWQAAIKNQKNVPTKLFEYMAYGLPIVSSDLPSTRPYVHEGENGHLVPADDPGAHARAVVHLLRNPDAAREMGWRGQESVRTRYNWDGMEARLLALVRQLLGGR